ncbi:hypothetical protein RFI_09000 [Reticulomyxa filosa]|uniref:Vesicle transport v-SNARE N-terminal domain-containing protein n=1 Tax=Reticulomyxa filosa TaxID=46433 RepID=X6NQY9_RETFI|nr:hypothetical protein RFI_09000 [Reticulomyxa filosa]|eukprot:ETO28134.1 hypothetical protein RFI_09000 [Reticulomyxa filosa]
MDHLQEMQHLEGEVKKVLAEAQKLVSRVSQDSGGASEAEKVVDKLDYAKGRIRAMEVEQRQIEDRQEARKFNPIIKDFQDQLKDLEQQLQWATGGKRLTHEEQQREKYGTFNRNKNIFLKKCQPPKN